MNDFQKQLHLINNYVSENLGSNSLAELYDPVSYAMSQKGKRLRPILTLLGCELFGTNPENALPAAHAIELLHNSTLVHDDIMDEADIRRGQPSVIKKFGLNSAVLSGDVMIFQSYNELTKQENRHQPALLSVLSNSIIEVCEGQQLDMNFEKTPKIKIADYLDMIEKKTAALLGCSLQLGAIIGDASNDDAELVNRFGRNIGKAFQIQDDLLDVYGDQAVFGKKIGGDIIQNKKTFLLVKAFEKADAKQQKEIEKWLKSNDETAKINGIVTIYDELKIRNEAEKMMAVYQDKSLINLNFIDVEDELKAPLRQLAQSLLVRQN